MPSPSTPSSAHPLARLTSLQAMLLLGSLGMLNILWSDMLFPVLVSIQQDLGTSATAVQQTVSLFFVANAFMCLWHGVLSDAWGRRKPLFIGLVVLVLTSLLSLLATRIEHLWILRTVQGLVVGLGLILCRAVIRDLYSGEAAQKMIAHTTLVQSVGTILLPMLGGWLTWMWGWRAVFAFLSAVGVVLLLVYARNLPESLPPARRQAIRLDSLWRNYRFVLGSPWFMRLTVAHACNWAALFLYVAAAPQLLTHLLGRSPTDVYLVFTPMMVGLIAGFLYLPRLVQRWGTQRTLYLAYAGLVFVNVLNTTLAAWVPPGLIHLLPIAAYAFAIALSMPLLVGHALHPFPDNAGLAASCQMFLQYSMMAVVAGLLAPLLWDSLSHLALGCAVLTCISMTLRSSARRPLGAHADYRSARRMAARIGSVGRLRAAIRWAGSTADRLPCASTNSSPARCRSASRPMEFARSIPGSCRPRPAAPHTPASALRRRRIGSDPARAPDCSSTRPISVLRCAERWSKLNEPTKIRWLSTASVLACRPEDEPDPNRLAGFARLPSSRSA